MTVLLRFADLKARGIVRNWVTLERWKRLYGFPTGTLCRSQHENLDRGRDRRMARVPPDRVQA